MQDRRPHVVGVLMEVAAWREIEAQSRNVPRNRILKDDALRELALQGPKDKARPHPPARRAKKALKARAMPTPCWKR